MRGILLESILASSPVPSSGDEAAAAADSGSGKGGSFWWWSSDCHGWWLDVSLVVPSALFLVFLLSQARRSFSKLSHGRSYIMITYYGLLWVVAMLNFMWCLLQGWQCTSGKETAWNLLSLSATSGMLFLEISLVAFLLQGNHVTGLEALTRTLVISGAVVCVDLFLKLIYIFGLGVPLFVDNDQTDKQKWSLWVFHRLVLTSIYGLLIFMHHSKWRDRLPARPAFYNYVVVMFVLNGTALLACALMGGGTGFGFWLYSFTIVIYHALYLPLLYLTFLADFFLEEDLHLENAYYSEMKDAGFFEGDWE